MVFSKRFPKSTDGSYPKWVDVALSEEEEIHVEQSATKENIQLFKDCIEDAKKLIDEKGLKPYQTDIISVASALFEKRSSHVVYHKERKTKDKFDSTL